MRRCSIRHRLVLLLVTVPRWFRAGGDMSINQLAYLYGEFALRIAGVYNVSAPPAK
jgi:hypothetical protein